MLKTTCEGIVSSIFQIYCANIDSFVEGSGPESLEDDITSQFTEACCFSYYTYTDDNGTSYFKQTGYCPSGCMYILSDGTTTQVLRLNETAVGCVPEGSYGNILCCAAIPVIAQ